VLHNRAAVELFKGSTDIAGGFRAVFQQVENLPTTRIGQSLEYAIVPFFN
jgi:hypothetical protein